MDATLRRRCYAAALKFLMDTNKVNQQRLADALGTSQAQISRAATGNQPVHEDLRWDIAAYFKTTYPAMLRKGAELLKLATLNNHGDTTLDRACILTGRGETQHLTEKECDFVLATLAAARALAKSEKNAHQQRA